MIKINLATQKQYGSLENAKGSKLALNRPDLDALKDLPIRKVVLPLVVGVLATYLLDGYKEEELRKLDAVVVSLVAEGNKIKLEADKIHEYEPIKKSLDQDETDLKTKLDIIRKLISERSSAPKVLAYISSSIPTDVWLTEFAISNSDVSMKGGSMGYNQISDFMKLLNENAYFSAVDLKNTKQDRDAGIEITSFELQGKRR